MSTAIQCHPSQSQYSSKEFLQHSDMRSLGKLIPNANKLHTEINRIREHSSNHFFCLFFLRYHVSGMTSGALNNAGSRSQAEEL